MRSAKALAITFCATFLSLTGCQSTSSVSGPVATSGATMLTQGIDKVDENYAIIKANSETYVLDTYIIPFQQPYYILVRKQDGSAFSKSIAETLATDYILTRGCTEKLVRRADLDKSTRDNTQHLISVAC